MILVDNIQRYETRLPYKEWCHMVSTENEDELHAFAERIGLRRAWAQLRPKSSAAHYDLTPSRRALAVKFGAVEVTSRELVQRNYDGLTRRRDPSRCKWCNGSLGHDEGLADAVCDRCHREEAERRSEQDCRYEDESDSDGDHP